MVKVKKYMVFTNYLVVKYSSTWNGIFGGTFLHCIQHGQQMVSHSMETHSSHFLILLDDEIKIEIEINYFSISNSFCTSVSMIHYVSYSNFPILYKYNNQ